MRCGNFKKFFDTLCLIMLNFKLVLFLSLTQMRVQIASAQCTNSNRTAFLRANGQVVQGFRGVTVVNTDLNRCAEFCFKNLDDKGKNNPCSSFQFGSSSCILSNVNAQPFGKGVLTRASKPTTAIYQKICIPASNICEKPFAFDWIPQTVLLGFASQVHHYRTVSECLKACLESADGVPCRSAMYFFESEQCILNKDSRRTRPDLFSNDTQGLIVDYFENVCASNTTIVAGGTDQQQDAIAKTVPPSNPVGNPAPSGYSATTSNYVLPQPVQPIPPSYQQPAYNSYGQQPQQTYGAGGSNPLWPIYCDQGKSTEFVITENMGIQDGVERKVENVDMKTCQQWCENNKNDQGEVSACQAFSLDSSLRTCTLISGLSMPRGSLHSVERNGAKFYEKVCLMHAQPCNGKYPFTRIPAHVLVGHAGEVRRVPDLAACLDSCLYARTEIGYDCHSVMYYYATTECIMNMETQSTRPDLFSADTQGLSVDYFDNNCIGLSVTTVGYLPTAVQPFSPPGSLPVGPPSPSPESTSVTFATPATPISAVFPTDSSTPLMMYRTTTSSAAGGQENDAGQLPTEIPTPIPTPSNLDRVVFSTECRDDGIRVNAAFKSPTTGAIFVKNKFQTCREEFRSAANAVLKIPLSENEKDCGQSQTGPAQFSFPIVLQVNGIGVLVQGLMTSDDLTYSAICSFPGRRPVANVANTVTVESVPNVSGTNPPKENGEDGKSLSPDTQISLDLVRDGVPVSNVLLGEQVEIHWRISAQANLGFFVRDCSAERVGGNPPEPAPLQLIKDGCPDQAVSGRIITSPITRTNDGLAINMTVFRFDGSRSVRLRCLIDVCAGECAPTRCVVNNREWQSLGRRKRASLDHPPLTITDNQNNSVIPVRKTTVSGVFTIVDTMSDGKRADDAGGTQSGRTTTPHSSSSVSPSTRKSTGIRDPSASATLNKEAIEEPETSESKSFVRSNGQLCLLRPIFIGIMSTLAVLCTAEGFVVTVCCWSRYSSRNFRSRSSSDSESTGSSEEFHKRLAAAAVRRLLFFKTAFSGESAYSAGSTSATNQGSMGMVEMNRRNEKRQRWPTGRSDDEYGRNISRTDQSTSFSRKITKISAPIQATVPAHCENKKRPNSTVGLDNGSRCSVSPSASSHYWIKPDQLMGGGRGKMESQWMLSPVTSANCVATPTPSKQSQLRQESVGDGKNSKGTPMGSRSSVKTEIVAYRITPATRRQ